MGRLSIPLHLVRSFSVDSIMAWLGITSQVIKSLSPDFLFVITLKKSEKSSKKVKEQLEANPNFAVQGWLQLDASKPEATIVAMPAREDVQIPIEEHLVVEFCSK